MNTRTEHARIIQMKNIEKHFGSVITLAGVPVDVCPGECHCPLGDNGDGKSTFIKTMSGVHKPTHGEIQFEGKEMHVADPRDAIAAGIATVHQHLAMVPPTSVSRNFVGNAPVKKIAGINFFDHDYANKVTMEEMRKMGINLRGPDQAVGTQSGGDRFTVLNRGKTLSTAQRGQITPDELQDMIAGGQELVALEGSLGGTV